MELIDDSDSDQEDNFKKRIKLAGTKHSDLAERRSRPEMRVRSISFSPTGFQLFFIKIWSLLLYHYELFRSLFRCLFD